MLDDVFRIRRLEKPTGVVDVILDTDAYNEVDDQFALAYLIRSPERINLKAMCAAPFLNERVQSAAEGMEKSYQEILHIQKLCNGESIMKNTYHGSTAFLSNEDEPVISPAAEKIIELAKEQPEDRPLYVISIGAITNVASALLMQPEIAHKIVVVWLGGHAYHWPHTCEFNMDQDKAAARVVFGSGVPMVQLPCLGVVSHLTTTEPELKRYLCGKSELCDYLYRIVIHEMKYRKTMCWSRTIWDISAAAWLMNDCFTADSIVHSPIPSYDGHYGHSDTRHLIKCVYQVNRDAIFDDLFKKLVR
jgi:inosine-uridine nucleoside N-ribohydrolase